MSRAARRRPSPNPPPAKRTIIFKAWIDGSTTGIPGAVFTISHELIGERTATANPDGIAWFLDMPGDVKYLNTSCAADGYTFTGPVRVEIPTPYEYYVPPFLLTPTAKPYPDPPTREQAISMQLHFQGLWIESAKYSEPYRMVYGGGVHSQIPYFGSAFQDFYVQGEGQQIIDQLKAAGDTHCMVFRTFGGEGYNHPNQAYGKDQLIPPANIQSDDLWREIIDFIITNGLIPVININCEGQASVPVVRDTFRAECDVLRVGRDRMPYLVWLGSWDGAWPGVGDGWRVDDMKWGIPFLRDCIGPQGYLGFMFGSPGGGVPPYLYVEDQGDYNSKPWMDGLDIVFTTGGPGEAEGVSLANKAGYMVRNPDFSEFQPDQGTNFLLHDCSRGRRQWLEGEWATYECNYDPGQTWKPAVDEARARMRRMNIGAWG